MWLPKELRKTMNTNKKDPMEIHVDEDSVILKKYQPACIFCKSAENTIEYKNKIVGRECLEKNENPGKCISGRYIVEYTIQNRRTENNYILKKTLSRGIFFKGE